MTKTANVNGATTHRVGSKYGLGKRHGTRPPKSQLGKSYVPIFAIQKLIRRGGCRISTAKFKLECRAFTERFLRQLIHTALLYTDYSPHRRTLRPEDVKEAARFLGLTLYN